jgi:hypothetical protein
MRTTMGAVVFFTIVSATVAAAAAAQDAQELVKPTDQIRKGFKTYSLFLVCNPGWLQPQGAVPQTQFLYRSFLNFGHAIGDDNLAVWFWRHPLDAETSPAAQTSQESADNVDVERSVRFCKAWRLKPSAGPHLVITSTFPNEQDLSRGLPKDAAVFELGNMNDVRITELLTKLTDQLLLSGKVEQPQPVATSQSSDSSPLWVRLLGVVQKSINDFGCAWTFKIDAGAVKADLHACQTKAG